MLVIVKKPAAWFKLPPQVRQDESEAFSEEKLRPLGESLQERQVQPVGARPDGRALWGFRRIRAAILVGKLELDTIVTEDVLTESQVRILQLTENTLREDLTAWEFYLAIEELARLNPAWSNQDLATRLHVDPATITRLRSPGKCVLAIRDALRAGQIGVSTCYELSKSTEPEQAALLALKLHGASRDAVAAAGRKQRKGNGNGQIVRARRVAFRMSNGLLVTCSTEGEFGLAEVVEAAQELTKRGKKASDDNHDVKTLARALADEAKA